MGGGGGVEGEGATAADRNRERGARTRANKDAVISEAALGGSVSRTMQYAS